MKSKGLKEVSTVESDGERAETLPTSLFLSHSLISARDAVVIRRCRAEKVKCFAGADAASAGGNDVDGHPMIRSSTSPKP